MLDTAWFVAVTIVIVAAVAGGWTLWELRRARPSAVIRGIFAIFTAATVIFSIAAVLNHHYSYIPDAAGLTGHVSPDLTHTTPFLAAAPSIEHGIVERDELAGPGFSAKPLYVYLPPAYLKNSSERLPVLYLLHGSPGIAIDWIRAGKIDETMDALVSAGAVHPFIIVMPDFDLDYTRDTQCQDIPRGPQMQTYLARDVVTYIDAHYRTFADRNDRVIGGFSAGAYCGVDLTMRHQDVFSAFESDSGYTVPDDNGAYTRDLFGGSAFLRRENTPADYLTSIPIGHPLGAYLEAGSADPEFRNASEWMASVLRRRGADVTLRIVPGPDHGWREAREHAGYLLRWASSWFESNSPHARTPDVGTAGSKPASF